MLALLPYNLDTPIYRLPWANFALLGAMTLVQVLVQLDLFPPELFGALILDGWSPLGLLGHVFLHVGWVHLIGNALFLYTFGNAVNAKLGHLAYLGLFFGLALMAGAAHNLLDGHRAVGASGAINGVVGMCFVLYPFAHLKMIFWFISIIERFRIRAVWMLLLFLAFDLWGAMQGQGRTAYWAHLGGFGAGAAVATALLAAGWVRAGEYEEPLLDWLRERWGGQAALPAPVPTAVPSGAAPQRPAAGSPSRWAHAAPLAPAPGAPPAATTPRSAVATPEAPIAVSCGGCGRGMQAPPRLRGRQVRCPGCGHVIDVG